MSASSNSIPPYLRTTESTPFRQPTVSATTENLAEAPPRSPAPVSTGGRSGVGRSSDGRNEHSRIVLPPETGEQPSLSSGLSDAPWLNRRRPGSSVVSSNKSSSPLVLASCHTMHELPANEGSTTEERAAPGADAADAARSRRGAPARPPACPPGGGFRRPPAARRAGKHGRRRTSPHVGCQPTRARAGASGANERGAPRLCALALVGPPPGGPPACVGPPRRSVYAVCVCVCMCVCMRAFMHACVRSCLCVRGA